MKKELDTEASPLSAPPPRGGRLGLSGFAMLLALVAAGLFYVVKSEAGRKQNEGPAPNLPAPNLYVPPGKLVVEGQAKPAGPAAKPAASSSVFSPPPLVRLAKARSLAEEIHELSSKAAEAQDLETGNLPLIRRLEAFHRSAGSLRSACRAAGEPGSDARSLRAQVELLFAESGEIDRRAAALSENAGRHWKTLASRLRELRLLV